MLWQKPGRLSLPLRTVFPRRSRKLIFTPTALASAPTPLKTTVLRLGHPNRRLGKRIDMQWLLAAVLFEAVAQAAPNRFITDDWNLVRGKTSVLLWQDGNGW